LHGETSTGEMKLRGSSVKRNLSEQTQPSCASVRKQITSVAAIVAPQTCTLVRDTLVLAHQRVPLFIYDLGFFSCDRPSPNNGRPCISWLRPNHHQTIDGLSFLRRPEAEEWESSLHASTGKESRFQCQATLLPSLSSKSSSLGSNTLFDLSSQKMTLAAIHVPAPHAEYRTSF
jgi:hypothetical protein